MCKRIYLSCCFLALLASCRKDVDGVDPVEWSDEPIRFSLSISGVGAGVTRAYDDKWEDNDRLGIYMVPYVAASTPAVFETYADAQNKEYRTENISDDKADLVEVSEALRYPKNGDGVSFVAYYPYRSTLASGDSHIYPVDVTNQTSPQAIDLLYGDTKGEGMSGSGGSGYTLSDNPVTMAFKHQLTKLVVKLVNDNEVHTPADYSQASVGLTVSGIPTAADFTLSTAALSNPSGDGVVITPVEKTKEEEGITWEAIVIPHEASAYQSRELMFTVGGNQYSVFLPSTVNFEGGKVYTFQCAYTPPLRVEFSDQCTITNWTDAATQSGLSIKEVDPVVTPTDVSALTGVPDGMTNCYVVAPNGELGFKVSRAFVYESDALTDKLRVDDQNSYTGKFGAEVVWETEKVIHSLVVEGSGKDAVVSLYTYNTEGNAVVKIYKKGDADKTALWSWHIWVTSYDPTADAGWNPKTNGGNTTRENVLFMDRNLGATEAGLTVAARGLFYQWGRKDPFPAKDNVAGFGVDQGPVTVTQAIQNPGTFYTMADGTNNNDWLASARDNTLWGGDAEDNPKTIYDPCPAGWRVPFSGGDNSSPWYGFGSQAFTPGDAGGYGLGSTSTKSYWPAAGFRVFTTGALAGLGGGGNYWSATVADIGAFALGFTSGDIGPSNGNYRAGGNSVRCVKEITP